MAWFAILRRFILLSLLLMPAAAYADLRSDMVKLDQAYVPALVLSGQGKPLSALAMDALVDRWDWFKQRQAYRSDRDTEWNFDLTTVEHAILTAKRWVDGGSYAEAHLVLEQVRITLRRMRQRIGMAYLPDALLGFEESVQALSGLMGDAQGGADADALRLNYERAAARWEEVLGWPVNPFEYGLNGRSGALMRRQMLDEQVLLTRFGQQLAAGERAAMGETLTEIRGCYIRIYSNFGRFPKPPDTASGA